MAHKKARPQGDNLGAGGGNLETAIATEEIIADSPSPDKSNLASPKQAAYLNFLRGKLGLKKWRAAKVLLSIEAPGTYDLTWREADKLIKIIKLTLQGES